MFYELFELAGFRLDKAWEICMLKGLIRQIKPGTSLTGPDGLAVHDFGLEEDFETI